MRAASPLLFAARRRDGFWENRRPSINLRFTADYCMRGRRFFYCFCEAGARIFKGPVHRSALSRRKSCLDAPSEYLESTLRKVSLNSLREGNYAPAQGFAPGGRFPKLMSMERAGKRGNWYTALFGNSANNASAGKVHNHDCQGLIERRP